VDRASVDRAACLADCVPAAPNWRICASLQRRYLCKNEKNIRRYVIALGQISHLRSARTSTGRVLQMERESVLHLRQVGHAAKQAVQVQLPRSAHRATADQETATMHRLLRMPLAPR
jgi:hypothetical protein